MPRLNIVGIMDGSGVQVFGAAGVIGEARVVMGMDVYFNVLAGDELTVRIRHPEYCSLEHQVHMGHREFTLGVRQLRDPVMTMGIGDGQVHLYHTVVDCRGPTMLVPTGRRMIQL